jgi:Holliday junction resolvasome RuvABC endonuclease subunit
MKIVGLDLSLTSTGVCVDGVTWSMKPKTRGPERLRALRDYVKEQCQGAAMAIIEGYSFGSRGRATFSIGELGGVIRLMLFEEGIPYLEMSPSSLKKFATGKGNGDKTLIVQAAAVRAGRIFSDSDQADAWWLWQVGLALYDADNPKAVKLPKTNLEVLKGLQSNAIETYKGQETS